MLGLNYIRHHTQVVTRPTIYLSFSTEKTPKNAKLVENLRNLAWCLELSYKAMTKFGCVKDVEKQRVLRWTLLANSDTFIELVHF